MVDKNKEEDSSGQKDRVKIVFIGDGAVSGGPQVKQLKLILKIRNSRSLIQNIISGNMKIIR